MQAKRINLAGADNDSPGFVFPGSVQPRVDGIEGKRCTGRSNGFASRLRNFPPGLLPAPVTELNTARPRPLN